MHSKISDHFPIILAFNDVPSVTEPNLNNYHQVNDYNLFIQGLSATTWEPVYNISKFNDVYEIFIKIFTEQINDCTSIKNVIINIMKKHIDDVTNIILER